MTYLNNFLHMADSLPDPFIYLVLGLSAFLENVFPPVPGDTITAFGAFLVGTKRLHFFGVFISTTVGSLSGFMFLFSIGSWLGRRFFIEKDFWFFKARDIIRAEEWLRKYGYLLVLLNRFFPGLRSVISIAVGISNIRPSRVALFALISCSVWNFIWIYTGYTLGSNWEKVTEKITCFMMQYNLLMLTIAGLVVFVYVVVKLIKRYR